MIDLLTDLCMDLASTLAPIAGVDTEAILSVLGPPPKHSRADVALPTHRLAKAVGVAPLAMAEQLAAAAAVLPCVAEAAATGPFVNVTWDTGLLVSGTFQAVLESRHTGGLVGGSSGAGRTVVLDFSSPNSARKLAFHHLRGTAVGAALARLWEAQGWRVVRYNFLGDYGHNIGQLLYKLAETPGSDGMALDAERLQRLYVEVNEEEAIDPERVKAGATTWLRLFEEQDPVAVRRWQAIIDSTTAALDATYERLGIHFDEYRGESNYVRSGVTVASELVAAGVAQIDPGGGAIYVPETDDCQAVVLVNRLGISTYEGRDCASAIERHQAFRFNRSVYLTDIGQAGRFNAVFAALGRAGFEWAGCLVHLGFGQMRLGGRKAKTRAGGATPLDDVLDEAVQRASEEIASRGMDLDDPGDVARQVGIGAVLFSQVRMRRTADFEFDLDAAVAFKGETAPRIQYTYARVMSILRKGGVTPDEAITAGDPALLGDPLERAVVMAVAGVPMATSKAVDADDPSFLADAALGVADAWGAYQSAGAKERLDLRVLTEDIKVRAARLRLAAVTACAIRDVLGVLGVECPERM